MRKPNSEAGAQGRDFRCAVERGVFGAPACFVAEEMFWGNDRLHFVEAALQAG